MDSGIVFIAGIRGSGKTHRIRELVVRHVARGRRVVVFDPSRDIYNGLASHYAGRQEGQRHFIRRYLTVAEYAAARKGSSPAMVSCVCPGTEDRPKTTAIDNEAPLFRALLSEHLNDGLVWVSDEAELVFNEWGKKSGFFSLVILARNSGSLLIVACKDPVRVSVDVRRGADTALVFKLKREAVACMRDVVDIDDVQRFASLRKRQFYFFPPITESDDGSEVVLLGADDDLPDEL